MARKKPELKMLARLTATLYKEGQEYVIRIPIHELLVTTVPELKKRKGKRVAGK